MFVNIILTGVFFPWFNVKYMERDGFRQTVSEGWLVKGGVWTLIWKQRALSMQGDRLAGKMTITGGHGLARRDGSDICISVTAKRVIAYHVWRLHRISRTLEHPYGSELVY